MFRTRGKDKGEHLTLHQFANDWISATTDSGKATLVNPTSIRLEPNEIDKFLMANNTGFFWDKYEHVGDRFVQVRRR